ncbi:ClC family H(+)/Cl(-) exchange transporter [Enterococcus sp.]|uniref:ClC family H(+)/Cl(-) exchange transporter n=1 Tax=Enterococcus sp. TaxID=35783 RepID=UPI0037C0A4AF
MEGKARNKMKYLHTHAIDTTRLLFIVKGILVGAVAGVIVSLFRLSIETVSALVVSVYHYLDAHPHLLPLWLAVSLATGVLIALLVRWEPQIKGSGIPQVEGLLAGELSYNWFSVLWKKFIGGILSVGSGLFLGREGPSIQLGAAVGQGISAWFKGPSYEEKILISSGASAGLSAAFNAPIAGLLFVLEEIHHSFSPLVWLTALTSALTANFVSLHFFGLQPVLYQGTVSDLPLPYYGTLVVLGLILGGLGRLYQLNLLSLPKLFGKLPLSSNWYSLVPFVLIIPIGLFFPLYLGGGNQIILQLSRLHQPLLLLIGLFVLRYLFSMVSYGAGLPGGIFLPILTLGGILGAIYGTILHTWFGLDTIYIKNFVIVAMAGYFTAIGKAPLTAIILVTEMVGSINHLMPLGLVSLTAYVVVDLLGGHPIYETLLERLQPKQMASIKGKTHVIELPVTVESMYHGCAVKDLNWPEHTLLIRIRRGAYTLIPKGDTILQAGDLLMVLTDSLESNQWIKAQALLLNQNQI